MSNPSPKPLSQRPEGYILAVVGGTLGGPFGWILSPVVLFALNQLMPEKEGKPPNRFALWALIGLIGVPLSWAPILGSISDPSVSNNSQEELSLEELLSDRPTTPETQADSEPEPKPSAEPEVVEEPPAPEPEPQVQTVVSLEGRITRYFLDDSPQVTVGPVTYDRNAGQLEFYNEVQGGRYSGYKYYFKCESGGAIYEKDDIVTNNQWRKMDDTIRCDVTKGQDGIPTRMTVVDDYPGNPFTLMEASFTPATGGATGLTSRPVSPPQPRSPTTPSTGGVVACPFSCLCCPCDCDL
jgi:hypothetical protein